jgi:hypothetical protein
MFSRIPRSALILLLCTCVLISASAQVTQYRLPRPVGLSSFVRTNLQPRFGRGMYNKLLVEGFYPIGWSRDGKFAYYTEPVDEACGCYFAELAIVDLRTDKVLWQFKNEPNDRVDAQGAPVADDIGKLWKRNEKVFAERLLEHRIEQLPRFTLLPSAFRSSGRSYIARVSSTFGKDEDGNRRIRKLDLVFSSPALGRKSLYSAEYTGDGMYTSPLDAIVAGAFKSPYENRVAIVMLHVQRGWEGPPHTVNVHIAGADLSGGFRK